MATCTGDQYVQNIERTECIGNSLVKINNNFKSLDVAVCSLEDLVTYINTLFVGSVSYFPSIAAPTGWLALSGQTVLRSEYSNLWDFAQSSGNVVADAQWTSLSAYGAFTTGDLSTTFRIPDLRGHFVRSSDTHTDGTVAGALGVKQDDSINLPKTTNNGTLNSVFVSTSRTGDIIFNGIDAISGMSGTVGGNAAYFSDALQSSISRATIKSGPETRPKNIAMLACIKY